MFTRFTAKRGFTLIELLVVVAIIALLISMLLPALQAAKEQAKVTVCLANMRSLGQATHTYFNDSNYFFPLYSKLGPTGRGVNSWGYGGKSCDMDWAPRRLGGGNRQGGVHYFTASEKPLNPYLMGQPVGDDEEVPLLQCPSDEKSHQRSWDGCERTGGATYTYSGNFSEAPDFGSYDDVGTSYHLVIEPLRTENPNPWCNAGQNWQRNLRALIKARRIPESLPFFLGDSADWAFGTMTQIEGIHRKFSYHNVAFLDGHAAYMYMDTRSRSGEGWIGLNPDWIVSDHNPNPQPFRYPEGWTLDPVPNPR